MVNVYAGLAARKNGIRNASTKAAYAIAFMPEPRAASQVQFVSHASMAALNGEFERPVCTNMAHSCNRRVTEWTVFRLGLETEGKHGPFGNTSVARVCHV